jgi:hypothetical protein
MFSEALPHDEGHSMSRETVGNLLERTKQVVIGAPDYMQERRDRWCAIIVDGIPFGEHYADEPKFSETMQLANTLVSCGVDKEIKELRVLAERPTTNTPDFEATLLDDRIIRIEVTQFTDPSAMEYLNTFDAIFNRVRELRNENPSLEDRLSGLHVIFTFLGTVPDETQKEQIARDIMDLLHSIVAAEAQSGEDIDVSQYAALVACDASCYVQATGQRETRVLFTMPRTLAESERIVEDSDRILQKKFAKYPGYSDSEQVEVWLAAFARDEGSGLGLTAIQEMRFIGLGAEPFERLLIANAVAGLCIEADPSKPIVYRSLTVEHQEISRT